MKKITLLLITLLMLTCLSSAANYNLKKTINGVGVITTISEGNSVTLTYVGEGAFSQWSVVQGGLSIADVTNRTITFNMPANNVEIEAVLHTHSYGEATCVTPPTCSCGATSGNALGHSYTGTRTCNVNGSTDKVQCIRCSATENQTCTHTYTINKGTVTNGTVTLSATSVKGGGSVTVTIRPSSGYEIDSIKVNNSNVTVSNKTGMTHTISSITENKTVTVSISKKAIIANADVALGAYITYTPSQTSVKVYGSDTGYGTSTSYQEFNPSNTTSWRVLYNNNGVLQIVSEYSVNAINGTGLYLRGKKGYTNGLNVLDTLCSAYVKGGIATGARPFGKQGSNSFDEQANPITYVAVHEAYQTWDGQSKYMFHGTHNDIIALSKWSSFSYLRGNAWWLAARDLGLYSAIDTYSLSLKTRNSSGSPTADLIRLSETAVTEETECYSIAPVVTLSSGIKIVDGKGTMAEPYIIWGDQ